MLKTTKMLDDQVVYRFERLPGSENSGSAASASARFRSNLDNDKIMALKLNIRDIEQKIKENNLNYSAGKH